MASSSVKGRVCATQKPTEFYAGLRTGPQAEGHDHLPLSPHPPRKEVRVGLGFGGYPNFTVTKEVGLWARAHLKNEVWIDTRGRPWIVTDNQVRHQYR